MKNTIFKLATMLSAFAMVIGISALSSACIMTYHQPEIPSSLDAYRK